MSNNTILLVFAIVNVLVTGLFAAVVSRQFAQRRRNYQLFWMIALLMAFFATLSYIIMIISGSTSGAGAVFFRLYYILGAALAPSWLGLGSIALVANRPVTRTCLAVLTLLSLLDAVLIAINPIDMHILSQVAGTPGTGILQPGFWLILTIILNTLGVLAVVGVAVYSGWKLWRRQSEVAGFNPGNLLWANVLILVGDLLNAAAGTTARAFGLSSSFWLVMAAGWIVFFIGVLLTGRRAAASKTGRKVGEEDKVKGSVASPQ
ncbi:MAG TPA: hypothetical protein VKR83_17190 [Ktedonobacteraceae bacterium]|nr:hypothetical protein [Ktedonobacteraceae bacterium]